jgi:hypothetical protein
MRLAIGLDESYTEGEGKVYVLKGTIQMNLIVVVDEIVNLEHTMMLFIAI